MSLESLDDDGVGVWVKLDPLTAQQQGVEDVVERVAHYWIPDLPR